MHQPAVAKVLLLLMSSPADQSSAAAAAEAVGGLCCSARLVHTRASREAAAAAQRPHAPLSHSRHPRPHSAPARSPSKPLAANLVLPTTTLPSQTTKERHHASMQQQIPIIINIINIWMRPADALPKNRAVEEGIVVVGGLAQVQKRSIDPGNPNRQLPSWLAANITAAAAQGGAGQSLSRHHATRCGCCCCPGKLLLQDPQQRSWRLPLAALHVLTDCLSNCRAAAAHASVPPCSQRAQPPPTT